MNGFLRAALAFTVALPSARIAHAQANATATRSLGFSTFGGYSRVNPDYSGKVNGYTLGGEANVHLHLFDPALEIRYGHSDKLVKESYFVGDIKLEKPLGPGNRFTPYLHAGAGYGSFRFPKGYLDSTIIKSLGGGVDVDLFHHLGARFDYAYQYWSFGAKGPDLNPTVLTLGLVCRFNPGLLHRF